MIHRRPASTSASATAKVTVRKRKSSSPSALEDTTYRRPAPPPPAASLNRTLTAAMGATAPPSSTVSRLHNFVHPSRVSRVPTSSLVTAAATPAPPAPLNPQKPQTDDLFEDTAESAPHAPSPSPGLKRPTAAVVTSKSIVSEPTHIYIELSRGKTTASQSLTRVLLRFRRSTPVVALQQALSQVCRDATCTPSAPSLSGSILYLNPERTEAIVVDPTLLTHCQTYYAPLP